MPELNPTFGDLGDISSEDLEAELGPRGQVHDMTVTSYDAIPNEEGARRKYTDVFQVICDIRAEKVVASLNRMTKRRDPATGKMVTDDRAQAEAGARMIGSVVIPAEREAFIDLLDDPERAFAKSMFDDLVVTVSISRSWPPAPRARRLRWEIGR